ncbi:MAG: DUF815 domain-containing protein, partial [Nanoarchaeota archaeon]
EVVGTALQDALIENLFHHPSRFVDECKDINRSLINNSVREYFRNSARMLKQIHDFDLEGTMHRYARILEGLRPMVADQEETPLLAIPFTRYLPRLDGIVSSPKKKVDTPEGLKKAQQERDILDLKKLVHAQKDWDNLDQVIETHYRSSVKVTDNELFTIVINPAVGLVLVPKPQRKKISFSDLVGYDEQRKQLIANTKRLLEGNDANNVFIHGPPGTGKSSMINALLTQYAEKGLRVVETDKEVIPHLSSIFSALERQDEKYIILVDEFRMGKDEELYDGLKKVVEGSFESMPLNARLYVVSNDKDCMRIGFNTGKEQRALEDRFGLVVYFPLPDEDQQRRILKAYVSSPKKRNGKFELVWKQFQEYCAGRSISNPNPRNIRDFVRTLQN